MNLIKAALSAVIVIVAIVAAAFLVRRVLADQPPIRVGVLHSLTGTMAISERSLVDAVELAISELNESGGVLGRRVEAVVADGQSNPETFAREAERLIRDEHVSVVFGCWTSGDRKTVKPVFEKYHHLLIYPLQYEGLEASPNIVYLGAAPNQQIIPALKWALGTIGRRVFLVGSDYVFPRAANAIIHDEIARWRGQVVGEEYIPLGGTQVGRAVAAIVASHPDVILNTLNGDSNVAFFNALRAAGVTPQKIPTVSFSIAEEELTHLPKAELAGDYAAWTYFQSVDSPANDAFIRAFRRRYGETRVTDDPIETAYVGVKLWSAAVAAAGTPDTDAVRKAIVERSYRAPDGMIFVDGDTRHAWRTIRIGRIRTDGQFDIVWSSDRPVQPVPFPPTRTPQAWNTFLTQLYEGWGSHWYNPR
jgi:urea transport system substrate-binding protein